MPLGLLIDRVSGFKEQVLSENCLLIRKAKNSKYVRTFAVIILSAEECVSLCANVGILLFTSTSTRCVELQ